MTPQAIRLAFRLGLVTLVLASVASCAKPSVPGDLKVTDITTGRALAPDGTIVEDARTTMFWSTDTFYVSVQTEGSADNVTMQARVTGPEGAKVEASKTVSPKGTTVTSFEAPPPKDGKWPDGDYKVEILVNGVSQGTRDLNART